MARTANLLAAQFAATPTEYSSAQFSFVGFLIDFMKLLFSSPPAAPSPCFIHYHNTNIRPQKIKVNHGISLTKSVFSAIFPISVLVTGLRLVKVSDIGANLS
jgi:hypothetical protein